MNTPIKLNIKFDAGPAAATFIISFLGFFKLLGFTGTGFAQPIPKNNIYILKTIDEEIINKLVSIYFSAFNKFNFRNWGPQDFIDLINNRSKIYSKTKYKIDCEGLNRSEIVRKIIKLYDNI